MKAKKSKILFIYPPSNINSKIQRELNYPPMGIVFLSSVVRDNGNTVKIFDGNVETQPFQKLQKLLEEFKPEVVGISFNSLLAESAYYTAEFIKKLNPHTTVIAGGYHPTVMPAEVINNDNYDFVVVGEGEVTFLEWLQEYDTGGDDFSGIKGLVFMKNGKLVKVGMREIIPNIDNITMPAYDLLHLNRYKSMVSTRNPYVTFIRSRGCPFKCTFCGVNSMFSHKYRCQSPEKTVSEIDVLVKKFHVKEILFKDSDFLINKRNVQKLCELLIEKKYDFIWSCNARVDMVDEHILTLMKNAGCKTVTYGVESGSQEIINRLRKGFSVEQAREAVEITKKVGIQCTVNIMFGNPGETKENVKETMEFVKEIDPDLVHFSNLTAFPGSVIYDEALENNWFIDGKANFYGFEDLKLNATEMTDKELSKIREYAVRDFYLRPSYILKRLKHFNFSELKNNLKGFFAIIRS